MTLFPTNQRFENNISSSDSNLAPKYLDTAMPKTQSAPNSLISVRSVPTNLGFKKDSFVDFYRKNPAASAARMILPEIVAESFAKNLAKNNFDLFVLNSKLLVDINNEKELSQQNSENQTFLKENQHIFLKTFFNECKKQNVKVAISTIRQRQPFCNHLAHILEDKEPLFKIIDYDYEAADVDLEELKSIDAATRNLHAQKIFFWTVGPSRKFDIIGDNPNLFPDLRNYDFCMPSYYSQNFDDVNFCGKICQNLAKSWRYEVSTAKPAAAAAANYR